MQNELVDKMKKTNLNHQIKKKLMNNESFPFVWYSINSAF